MKPPAYLKFMRIVFVCSLIALLSGAIIGHAQEETNLLTNPGFEAPFQSHGGNPPRQVAQGWIPWHQLRTEDMPLWRNAQPIYDQAAPDVTRIRSGNNAQKIYNDIFVAHNGGVYQQVTGVTPGAELRFSIYAWVWSSGQDNLDFSEDPGDVTIEVGIDPTGGTNPNSSNIIWSIAVSQYDAYRQYSVIATATGSAVTVFVRSYVDFAVEYTYVYLDDAVLSETVEIEPTTEVPDTDVPPTEEPTDVPPTSIPVSASATPVPATEVPATEVPATEVPATAAPTDDQPTPTQEADATTDGGIIATQPVEEDPTATPTETSTEVDVDEDSPFPGTLLHTVQRGDTVGRLAVLYGSTIQAIVAANDLNEDALIFVGQGLTIPVPMAAPATAIATSVPTVEPTEVADTDDAGDGTTYIVRAGDTLYRIALRYDTTVSAIAEANGILNANLIRIGQVLVLDGSADDEASDPVTDGGEADETETYTVQSGDNLYRISLRFGVSMAVLSEVNGIWNVNKIFAGQVLQIP